MKLSIVTTLYKSERYIEEFYIRIKQVADRITSNYEIIFVNDGSPDNSFHLVENLIIKDDKVRLIDLSKNFGHHQAMMAGLDYTKGEYVFLIDCDLEESPEDLMRFWNEMQSEKQIDVIYGVQERRKGKIFERFTGDLFYLVFNYCSNVNIPRSLVTSRLMTSKYVESLRMYGEREFVAAGIWYLVGFKQKSIFVKKGFKGGTTYSFLKKIEMMWNAIISFSEYPLILIFRLGMGITFLALLALIYIVLGYFISGQGIAGWRSLIVSIWFFGGLTLMCLGIIGRYIGKIFIEVKQRPRVVVKQILQR